MSGPLRYLLIVVLLLLQGLQPLLHVHVNGAGHEERLVHFHPETAAVPASAVLADAQVTGAVLGAAAAPDAPYIGVGQAVRKNPALAWTPASALPASIFAALREAGAPATALPQAAVAPVYDRSLLPPALASPNFS